MTVLRIVADLASETPQETAAFYERVLGLVRHAEAPGRHVFFKLADQVLLLFNPNQTLIPDTDDGLPIPTHGAQGQGHICFRLDPNQEAAWRAHLEQEGVEIESDFIWPGTGARSIYFRDPAGNSVELGEAKIWF